MERFKVPGARLRLFAQRKGALKRVRRGIRPPAGPEVLQVDHELRMSLVFKVLL